VCSASNALPDLIGHADVAKSMLHRMSVQLSTTAFNSAKCQGSLGLNGKLGLSSSPAASTPQHNNHAQSSNSKTTMFTSTATQPCSLQQWHDNPVYSLAPSIVTRQLEEGTRLIHNTWQDNIAALRNLCTSPTRPHGKAHCRLPPKEVWKACQGLYSVTC
jgi:hypothetical protein